MRGVELSNVDINGVYTGPLVGAERDLAVLEARGS